MIERGGVVVSSIYGMKRTLHPCFCEKNLSVLWLNPPWSVRVDNLLFEIQTTVFFGLILRVEKLMRNMTFSKTPWMEWLTFSEVQTKVFFGLPSIDGKQIVSGMNILLFLRIAYLQPFDLHQPIGVILLCFCLEVNGFGWFLNGPLACPP